MELILALLGVIIIPIIIILFLPKREVFFQHGIVRGFGLGVYLMLVLVLFREATEESSINSATLWLTLGILVSLVIGVLLKEFHHHHNEEEKAEHHNRASMTRILVSDFFHNIVDGLALIAGFAISPAVGIISFAGVLGHQIIQQVGQQILLVGSGLSVMRAIVISFFVALSIFLGFFIQNIEIGAVLLAFSAGIVAWKVWADLTHTTWDKKVVTGFVSGALVLAIILISIPHGHGSEDEDEHAGEETHEENRDEESEHLD